MRLTRRAVLTGIAGSLAAPALAQSSSRVLRFIPRDDVGVLDPHWTTSGGTRTHAFLVFDTLFGEDAQQRITPQMVQTVATEDDGHRWRLSLRDGLRFHDGEPVLAADCVASINRWGRRDPFGRELLAATDELSAPDDRTIQFRLKRPFPLLPTALGKSQAYIPAIMPARLANSDPNKQLREMVGSGPFRFKADEWNPGARIVYERFAEYRPCEQGTPSGTAGPKMVNFDRVEWNVVTDPGTALATLKAGEADWLDYVLQDLAPAASRDPNLVVRVLEPSGMIGIMRLNHLVPPFDNPVIRRAVLGAVDQTQFMRAMAGDDTKMWRAPVGVFCPATPMANDAGMAVFTSPRDSAKTKQAILAAGYAGESVVVLNPADSPSAKALSDVTVQTLREIGLQVDDQSMDWSTVQQRRQKRDPVAKGGWSVFCSNGWNGTDMLDPVAHTSLRANGLEGWFGWPTSPKLESLRQDWMAAPSLVDQQRIAAAMQLQCWVDVPYIPLGQSFQPTAYRTSLEGILAGFPVFWNVKRVA